MRFRAWPGVLALGILVSSATAEPADNEKRILTPRPGPEPKINGPAVLGTRPKAPFIYRIPCTGTRPMRFSAAGLPRTLRLDRTTGIITGRAPEIPGQYTLALRALNRRGRVEKSLRIVVGDKLALTPPMGWNGWYTHYDSPTDRMIRRAADAMTASGMADFGYQYVNIDDCWSVKPGSADPDLGGDARNPDGTIRPNRRFPDMADLTRYIHSKGLKAGIYTSPGPLTCAAFAGSYGHEEQDAHTFAEWGFDFLKYDLCTYRERLTSATFAAHREPYSLMGRILRTIHRDIVFNLCQYGLADVWTWGAQVGGHSWRTTGDLGVEKATDLPGFYSIGFRNAALHNHAGAGAWNDPDYILIGSVGNALKMHEPPKATPLTPQEQYSYMSMWALMAAPLIFSGDMDRLDPFTLNVLCNSEVIDVDQDQLGKQARQVRRTAVDFALAKPLADGSLAVGLFNITPQPREIAVGWEELGIRGHQVVRDLWRQRNVGTYAGAYSVKIPSHGVMLVKLSPGSRGTD